MNEYFVGSVGKDLSLFNANKLSFKDQALEKRYEINSPDFQLLGLNAGKDIELRAYDIGETLLVFKVEKHIKVEQVLKWKKEISDTILDCKNIGEKLNSFKEHLLLIIYRKKSKTISIYNDRFGLFPIYFLKVKGGIYFANDIKCFLGIEGFKPKIDENACRCFIYSGQLLGDISWFEGIKYLSASTRLRYNQKNQSLNLDLFWSWSHIHRDKCSFKDAVYMVKKRLENSVRERVNQSGNNSLFLSGGRDSSAIVISQEKSYIQKAYLLTIKENQRSIRTAEKISREYQIQLMKLSKKEVNSELYLEALWNLSCDISITHLHFAPFNSMFNNEELYFNGIPGDLNIGGTFMTDYDSRINLQKASRHPSLNCHYLPEYLGFIDSSFFDYEGTDPFYFDTRMKRFTLRGMQSLGLRNHSFPLMDLKLNDILYSINPSYRKNRKLYNQILEEYKFHKYNKVNLARSGFEYVKKKISKSANVKGEKLDLGYVNDILKQNEIIINKSIPSNFTEKRLLSINSWIKMIYE